jgi:hypothetical protein
VNVTGEELDELRSLHQLGVEAAQREHMEHAKRWHLIQERLSKRVAVRRTRRQEASRQEHASVSREEDVSVTRPEDASVSRQQVARACRHDMGVEGQSKCEEFATGKPVRLVGSADEAEAKRRAQLFALL